MSVFQQTTIPIGELEVNGYLATAQTNDIHAGVVVIHEIEGLTEHFGNLCSRLAEAGYSAIAPDLFARDPRIVDDVAAGDYGSAVHRVYELGPERLLGDLESARDTLVRHSEVDPSKVAVIGFCLGGYLTLLAATDPDGGWAAAAPFYGPPAGYGAFGVSDEPNPLTRAENLSCPTRLFYGRHDDHIPAELALEFATKAESSGQPVEVVLEDAGHAFFNDSRPTYVEAAATHAWAELLTFLDNTFKE